MSAARHWTRRLPYSNPDRTDQTNEPDADETIEVTSQSMSQVTRNPQEPIEIVRMAPQVGFGTAGAECERGDALPEDNLGANIADSCAVWCEVAPCKRST